MADPTSGDEQQANRGAQVMDWQQQNRRQAYLDRLYQLSGRTCGTYTGLLAERQRVLVERDMRELLTESMAGDR
jgi:hypothetical protein